MKKKINWWVILAVLVIGIPIGYVAMGIINRTSEKPTASVSDKEENEEAPEPPTTTEDPTSLISDNDPIPPDDEVLDNTVDEQEDVTEPVRPIRSVVPPREPTTPRGLPHVEEPRPVLPAVPVTPAINTNDVASEERRLQQEEEARQLAEQAQREKEAALKNEVQAIVANGQSGGKVPDGCPIVVNGRNATDYQQFRQGVNYRTYSNVRVTSVETDRNGNVIKVSVAAVESDGE